MSHFLTFPTSLIPFIEHNDPTRCQMSDSQMRQSLILEEPDFPLVGTGYEYVEHLELYMFKAEDNGKVIFKNNSLLLIQYKNGNVDYFPLDPFMKCYVKVGDNFKKNDILVEHMTMKDGTLRFGKNLLCAYMAYYGNVHDDAIVMSESAAEKFKSIHKDSLTVNIMDNEVLISLDKNSYQPLPKIGQIIKAGEPILRKKILTNSTKYLFQEPTDITLEMDIKIENIEIYPNDWNKNYAEYDRYMIAAINNAKKINEELSKLKDTNLQEHDIEYINHLLNSYIANYVKKLQDKGLKFPGIHLIIHYTYNKFVQVGDKFANRHGNKGVISKILPEKEMPKTEWGQPIDIILGNLSVISRMNPGQLFELHASLGLVNLKKKLLKMYDQDPNSTIKSMLNIMEDIDTTYDKWYSKTLKETVEKYGVDKKLIEDLVLIQPPFESFRYKDLNKFLKLTNTKESYKVILPNGKKIGPVALGYMYIIKLNHTVIDKIKVRSIGSYTKKNMMPPRGGAQRIGEMEIWAFMAYDAMNNLKDILVKSDNFNDKINVLRKLYNTGFAEDVKLSGDPSSLNLFKNYMRFLGISVSN